VKSFVWLGGVSRCKEKKYEQKVGKCGKLEFCWPLAGAAQAVKDGVFDDERLEVWRQSEKFPDRLFVRGYDVRMAAVM
jgi:hypothetical protein